MGLAFIYIFFWKSYHKLQYPSFIYGWGYLRDLFINENTLYFYDFHEHGIFGAAIHYDRQKPAPLFERKFSSIYLKKRYLRVKPYHCASSFLENIQVYDPLFSHKKNYYYNYTYFKVDYLYKERSPAIILLNLFSFLIKFYLLFIIYYFRLRYKGYQKKGILKENLEKDTSGYLKRMKIYNSYLKFNLKKFF